MMGSNLPREMVLIGFGIVAVDLAFWFVSGKPPPPTHVHADQHLTDNPKDRFITERSEYMRSER
jgi:hypothetical protein